MVKLNYEDYVNLVIVPPPLFFGFAVIGFLPPICFFICSCCKGRTAKRLELYCLLGMYKVITFTFRNAIQKREVNLDENGREVVGVNQTVVRKVHRFILFNRIISRLLIPFVFPSITALFVCFLVAFWGTFLNVESQNICDPDLDCFLFDTDMNPLQNDPIVNCTDFNTGDNVAIICYQFNLVDALGLAGGLLTFTHISIKLLGRVLVWSMQPCCEEGEKDCCKRYCFWSDSPWPQRHDDIDLFLPDDLEAGGCCRRNPNCYTNYKLHVNPDHYNKVQYYCCSYCYPCFKIAVRIALVLAPFIIFITRIVARTISFFRINYLDYQVAIRLLINATFLDATFLAYTLIFCYFGVLSLVFVVTLQCSKHNKY